MLLKNLVLIFFVSSANGNPLTLGGIDTGNIPVAEEAATNNPFPVQNYYFQPQGNNTGITNIALNIAGGNVSLTFNGLSTTTDPIDRPEESSKQKDTLVTVPVTGGDASVTLPGNETNQLNDRPTETSTQMEMLVTESANDQSRSNGSDYNIFIYQNVTYKLHAKGKNWLQANNICFREGGHLVVIDSGAEEELLLNMMRQTSILFIWVGVHSMLSTGEWVTVHDKPLGEVGYVHWSSGQPSGPSECVLLGPNGLFNIYCIDNDQFVCEIAQNH